MLLFQNLNRFIHSSVCRFSSTTTANSVNRTLTDLERIVDPFSKINIISNCNLILKPYDVHSCPDSNKMRARVMTTAQNSELTEQPNIEIKIVNKIVEILTKNVTKSNEFNLLLEVPIKSDLDIIGEKCVTISEMYSDNLKITAEENLSSKNIRSTTIDLQSINGNIKCDGITLGQKIGINTKNKGKIILDKLQGDLLYCKTFDGDIETNSCYVEKSSFATETGNLILRNIHKTSEIYILKKGNIEMIGIHGNIYVKSNAGNLNLQFSEIFGDNIIMADNPEKCVINISDLIEENSFVEAYSDNIELDSSLEHLQNCIELDNHFMLGEEENNQNKLLICTRGLLKLGKMSWADSLKLKMSLKDN